MPSGCSNANERGRQMPDTPCDGGTTTCPPVRPACTLTLRSETRLTFPSDRTRTRIAVTEEVIITALGAQGTVTWSVTGSSSLNTTSGGSVTLTAHVLPERVTVEARDGLGCTARIEFTIECCYLITQTKLRAIFPTASIAVLDDMTNAFNEAYELFSVSTCLQKAHFFAQVMQEASDGTSSPENLHYTTASRLIAVWPTRFTIDPAQVGQLQNPARPFNNRTNPRLALATDFLRNPRALANRVYFDRNGNGNEASNDGWNFRGRGYLQVTGRGNYTSVQNEINTRFSASGVDITTNFTDIDSTRGGMIAAMGFWTWRNLHTEALEGDTNAVVDSVTAAVNRGTNSYGERIANFHNTQTVFRTNDCPNRPTKVPAPTRRRPRGHR